MSSILGNAEIAGNIRASVRNNRENFKRSGICNPHATYYGETISVLGETIQQYSTQEPPALRAYPCESPRVTSIIFAILHLLDPPVYNVKILKNVLALGLDECYKLAIICYLKYSNHLSFFLQEGYTMKTYVRISVMIAILLVLGVSLSLAQVTPPPKALMNLEAKTQIRESSPFNFPRGFLENQGQPPTLAPGALKTRLKEQAPISWDWRTGGGGTAVKDQGPWPTCWIFASVGDVESKIKLKESPPSDPDYSEMDILEGIAEGTRPPADPLAGGNPREAANHFSRYACLDETDNPYSTAGVFPVSPVSNYWNPPKGTPLKVATEWHDLGNMDSIGQVTLLKNIIHTAGPVTASVRIDTIDTWATGVTGPGVLFSSFNWNSDWVVPYLPETLPTDHSILIIGWDDNKPWYGGGGTGAWLVKNSWGTAWGAPSADAGYFYIAYGSARIGAQAGYYPRTGLSDHDSSEILLHYDEFGSWGAAGWTGVYDIYMLNVFTPPDHGRISAVDFWATYQNLEYDIRIYDSWSDTSSSPTALLGSAAGALADAGYYSIPIDPPAKVHSGDDIYVMIRVREKTGTYHGLIPYEVDASDTGYNWLWFTNTKQSETNKSYARFDTGSGWAGMNPLGDVGVRARFIPPISEVEDWTKY